MKTRTLCLAVLIMGGHKLERAVLRPSTCLTCRALTRRTSTRSSSRLYTGFQSTPVASIATWVTPSASSQSRKVNNSCVIVPKVRTSWRIRRSVPTCRTQTLRLLR